MISEERIKSIEYYKFEVCPEMGMDCWHCICENCPRDCKECEKSGVEGHSEQCIYMGNGRYRT